MRKFGFMEILLLALTALVVLAILVMVLALAYPDATASIMRDAKQQIDEGQSPVVAVATKVGRRFADGFNYRIKPIINKIADLFTRWGKKPATRQAPAKPKFAAKDCIKCHKTLFDQRGFSNIYVDHRLHDAGGIKCPECHDDTKHPKPARVAEKTCLNCHRAAEAAVGCRTCHPPGSILDAGVIPEAQTAAFLSDRSVSSRSIMPNNFATPDKKWLHGEGEAPCLNCHDAPEFCNRCHLVFHNKIPSWRTTHGPRLLKQELVMNVCWDCHNANWCAGTCHTNPNAERRRSFLPVPVAPLENYLR